MDEKPRASDLPNVLAVLAASDVVNDACYKLWQRMWPLDQGPRGCYASAELLGRLVKAQPATVEENRRLLHVLGLLEKVGQGRATSWRVCFPPQCILTGKPTFDAQVAMAKELGRVLRSRLPGAVGKSPGFAQAIPAQDTPENLRQSAERTLENSLAKSGADTRGFPRDSGDSLSISLPSPSSVTASLPIGSGGVDGKRRGVQYERDGLGEGLGEGSASDGGASREKSPPGYENPEWKAMKAATRPFHHEPEKAAS